MKEKETKKPANTLTGLYQKMVRPFYKMDDKVKALSHIFTRNITSLSANIVLNKNESTSFITPIMYLADPCQGCQ